MICKTCTKEFVEHHNTQRYCSDDCTPYKNKFMAWDTWRSMHKRCKDPKTNQYENYGGRGITVCEEWDNYHTFIGDMGLKPSLKHQLDRIDNDKGYFKDNCRWVTASENQLNRADVRWITWDGKTQNLCAWAEQLNLAPANLSIRISKWGLEAAMTTPHGLTGPKRGKKK